VHWADGGPTDLANLVLLCTAHHDLVHHGGWTVRFTRGRASLHPPDGHSRGDPPDDP